MWSAIKAATFLLIKQAANIHTSVFFFSTTLLFYFADSSGAGGKVVRLARVPMGGWAEECQAAPRHHEPLPEESSEDEMPPHIHKVKAVSVCPKLC